MHLLTYIHMYVYKVQCALTHIHTYENVCEYTVILRTLKQKDFFLLNTIN